MRKQFVNGKVYDWSSITIGIMGCGGIEPTSIDYEDGQDKELVFGKNGEPRGFGTGNKTNSIKLEMLREDYNTLIDAYRSQLSGGFYKMVIPKITISYADEGATTTTDVLTNVTFTKRSGFGGKAGDKSTTISLEGIAMGGIIFDGVKA